MSDPLPLQVEILGKCDSPDEIDLNLGKRARKALDYLLARLEPLGFKGHDAHEFLERIMEPLIKATHSKKSSWKERLVASRMLGELVGLYAASDRRGGAPLTQQVTINVVTGVPKPDYQRIEIIQPTE